MHASAARRKDSAVPQQLADGGVRQPVLVGITDANDRSIRKDDPAGALDLDEEELHRIGGPGDLQAAVRKGSVLDLGAAVIRNAGARLVHPPPARHSVWPRAAHKIARDRV